MQGGRCYLRSVRGLYAIIDIEALDARSIDPLRFAEAVVAGRPAALQVRDKASPPRAALARGVRDAARRRRSGCAGRKGGGLIDQRPSRSAALHRLRHRLDQRLRRCPILRRQTTADRCIMVAIRDQPESLDHIGVGPSPSALARYWKWSATNE